jgi:capsular exopolysaccharide synthesis family protein
VAAIIILCLGAALAVAITSPRKFTATATLRISPPQQTVAAAPPGMDSNTDPTSALIETEVGELQSVGLAKSVVEQLGLTTDPEFNPGLKHPGKRPQPPPGSPAAVNAVALGLLGHVKIVHVGTSYLLNVQAVSGKPNRAADIANAFVQQFMLTQQNSRTTALEEGGSRISDRVIELRHDVERAETALQQYKIANGLLSAQGSSLTEQEISSLDQELAQARAQEAEADARLSTAKAQMAKGSSGADVGEALNSPVIQQLRQRRAQLTQNLADLEGRYGDAHPKLLSARRELADTDSQIQAEINRIVSNLDAQAKVAHQRAASMGASVNAARGNLAQNNRATVQLDELQRNADAANALYNTFLTKYKEADAEAGIQQSDAVVVDWAPVPTGPSAPKRGLIIAFGLFAGLTLAIGYVIIAEQTFAGLSDADAVEAIIGRPYLGSIPILKSTLDPGQVTQERPIDYVVTHPLSSFTEAFRSLTASARFSNQEHQPQVIAVTSSLPNEGKTTTSICMARVSAASAQRTVLVDCDMRKRSVNRALRIEPTVGLAEVLAGHATLEQALVRDDKTDLMILPIAKKEGSLPRDAFSGPAMAALLEELRKHFELIILDTGPVVLVTSTRQVAAYADAVILIAQWRKTTRRLLRTSLRLLDAAAVPVAGIALGLVDLRKSTRVDPADPSSYYRAYKDYYIVD